MPERIPRRRLLAGAAAAAVALVGGTAAVEEFENDRQRSTDSSAIGQRIAGRRPHEARIVWSVETVRPQLALTFDDGPDPDLTPRVLEALAAAGARATFLMVGDRVRAHPAVARAVVAAGHEVGSHTRSHADLGRVGQRRTTAELVDGAATIEDVTGERVRWFRPPWGHLSGSALRVAGELGHDVLLWTTSNEHLHGRLRPGEVLLLHDAARRAALRDRRDQQVGALPELLRRVAAASLQTVTASELLLP